MQHALDDKGRSAARLIAAGVAVIAVCFISLLMGVLGCSVEEEASSTWIVDPRGGPDCRFTDLVAAISDCKSGDRLVVRGGVPINGFDLNKGLIIVAETGCRIELISGVTISGIRDGFPAMLAGFLLPSLEVRNCLENIFVDDCVVGPPAMKTAVRIEDCTHVILSRSKIEAGVHSQGIERFEAMQIAQSRSVISECVIHGGHGADGDEDSKGTDGTEGIFALDSTLCIHATSVLGGPGGSQSEVSAEGAAGNGAAAIRLEESSLELFGLEEHLIEGGACGVAMHASLQGENGPAVHAMKSEMAYSGVTIRSNLETPIRATESEIKEISPAVPVIMLEGTGQLDDSIRIRLHGPPKSFYEMYCSFDQVALAGGVPYPRFFLQPGYMHFMLVGEIASEGCFSLFVPITDQPERKGLPIHVQAFVKSKEQGAMMSTSASFMIR
jgi:hypothetical protein